MPPTNRQNAYHEALSAANAELDDLLATVKSLQVRMQQLEDAREALTRFVSFDEQSSSVHQPVAHSSVEPDRQWTHQTAPAAAQPAVEPEPVQARPVQEESNDPILRRINRALGQPATAEQAMAEVAVA